MLQFNYVCKLGNCYIFCFIQQSSSIYKTHDLMIYCILSSFFFVFKEILLVRGRIIKPLTVYPTCCTNKLFRNNNNNNATNHTSLASCGILRLDGIHTWTLRSGDGVYENIPVTVSIIHTVNDDCFFVSSTFIIFFIFK